jgi:cytochrome c
MPRETKLKSKETAMRGYVMTAALALATGYMASALTAGGAAATSGESRGVEAFNNNCRTCHSWKKGDNRLGPNLHGIIGRKAGAAAGFTYSPSLENSNITWDEHTLDKFIANPESIAPGNNMKPFTGIADASTREEIIEFLKSNPN